MKKRKLKPFVKVTLVGAFFSVLLFTIVIFTNKTSNVSKTDNDFIYVNDYIFDSYYPVVSDEEKLKKPYTLESVSVHKDFYEKDASEESQQNSIIYHEGIYMQNSGIDYRADEQFDVVAAISGVVTNVNEDALLGKTIEVRTSTDLITVYQSLGEIAVKKGDTITQGQIIGKSGTCPLNSDVKQGLHFEMYKNGQVFNPNKYYDKEIKELTEN